MHKGAHNAFDSKLFQLASAGADVAGSAEMPIYLRKFLGKEFLKNEKPTNWIRAIN